MLIAIYTKFEIVYTSIRYITIHIILQLCMLEVKDIATNSSIAVH